MASRARACRFWSSVPDSSHARSMARRSGDIYSVMVMEPAPGLAVLLLPVLGIVAVIERDGGHDAIVPLVEAEAAVIAPRQLTGIVALRFRVPDEQVGVADVCSAPGAAYCP